MTPSGIEPANFHLLAQWLNQIRNRVPLFNSLYGVRCGLRYRKIWQVVGNVSKESDDSIMSAQMDLS